MSENQNAWQCKACGAENYGKFCTSCGTKKPEEPVVEAAPVNPVNAGAGAAGVSGATSFVSTGTPRDQVPPVGQPYAQPGTYQQQNAYQQPGAYGQLGGYGQPGSYPTGGQPNAYEQPGGYPTGEQPGATVSEMNGERSAALSEWKTDVLFSILGLAILSVITVALAYFVTTYYYVALCILGALEIAYAAVVYPSYFKEQPLVTDSRIISMLNLFFGGLIFGCLWNACLTNSKKGVSWIVYIVIQSLALLSVLAAYIA